MSLSKHLVLFATLTALSSAVAFAGAFQNGDLVGNPLPGAYATATTGSTQLPGWTITSGSVDLIGTYWQAPAGTSSSVDLNGMGPGTISQTFDTILNHLYQVSFYWAPNPDNYSANSPRTALVTLDGSTKVSLSSTTIGSLANMGWQQSTFTFTGTGSNTLAFVGQEHIYSGIAIGHIQLSDITQNTHADTATPEPASIAIMAGGLLLVGLRRFRKA